MDGKQKLRGQIRVYMQWPIFMSVILIAMNGWIYFVDRVAGMIMTGFVLVYIITVFVLYYWNKKTALLDLLQMSNQFETIQDKLLDNIDTAVAITTEDGKIVWKNCAFGEMVSEFHQKEQLISRIIPAVNKNVFPGGMTESFNIDVQYQEKELSVEMQRISTQGLKENSEIFQSVGKGKSFIGITFVDETRLNEYKREQDNQKLITGLIYIDNYDELLDSVEEEKQALFIATVERKINQYIAGVDGIIKKLEKDKYFVIIKKKNYKQIEEDKFSLLEEVKDVNMGNTSSASLSIGLGLAENNYIKSYSYARVAIDLALARGGDQAIFKNGDDLSYYGGKRELTSRYTRVKARVKAEALREFISQKDQVMIMGHKIADVDSFGAAVGIYRAAVALEKQAFIVINEITTSVKPFYEAMLNDEEYPSDIFLTSDQVKHYLSDNTMTIVVDTNRPQLCDCEYLLENSDTIAVLDHHRQNERGIQNAVLSYIEPYASSASEMVAEILQYITENVKLRGIEADCLYSGILIDTNNFMNRTGVRTFEAAAYLKRCGADVTRVRKLFRDDMDSYRGKAEAIKNAEVYKEHYAITTCPAKGVESPTVLGAQTANELLDISKIKASFVLTDYNGVIYLSARSIDELNVQVVAEKLGGGGHINVAGAQFKDMTIAEVIKQLKVVLDETIERGDI